MKCTRVFRLVATFFIVACISSGVFANEKVYIAEPKEIVHIDFSDLKIEDLINLTSKIINRNILITTPVNGKVDFISTTPIYKDEILDLLLYVLDTKGFTLVEDGTLMRIIRSSDASKENLPIRRVDDRGRDFSKNQIVTEAFYVRGENVDIVASKIRHMLTNQAKLITIKESNTILLTDVRQNIETIKKIIDIIRDDSKKEVELIELKNLKAATALAQIQRLANAVFNQRVDTEKVDIIADVPTNTILLIGNTENVEYLKDHIDKLDSKASTIEQRFEVIPLKNSDVQNMIKSVNEVIARKIYQDPAARPIISANEELNSLIVLGPKDEIDIVKSFVEELDKDQQQVYVKARIIEISQRDVERLGVKYGLEGGMAKKYGLFTFAGNLGGSSIALSSSILGFINTDVVKDGLALGAAVDFLNSNEAANIISEPSILSLNNKESSIYVGQTQSILTSAVAGENANDLTRNNYKREDIGLTLKVKPRISNDNKVTLEVDVKVEDVIEGSGGGGQPTTTKREVKTLAIVRNGETVIVGGLIKDKLSENVNKLPLLGDIPLLGMLFKNTTESTDKTNLIVMLTPYIIPTSGDLSNLREVLSELDKIQEEYSRNTLNLIENRKSIFDKEAPKDETHENRAQETIDRVIGN